MSRMSSCVVVMDTSCQGGEDVDRRGTVRAMGEDTFAKLCSVCNPCTGCRFWNIHHQA